MFKLIIIFSNSHNVTDFKQRGSFAGRGREDGAAYDEWIEVKPVTPYHLPPSFPKRRPYIELISLNVDHCSEELFVEAGRPNHLLFSICRRLPRRPATLDGCGRTSSLIAASSSPTCLSPCWRRRPARAACKASGLARSSPGLMATVALTRLQSGARSISVQVCLQWHAWSNRWQSGPHLRNASYRLPLRWGRGFPSWRSDRSRDFPDLPLMPLHWVTGNLPLRENKLGTPDIIKELRSMFSENCPAE